MSETITKFKIDHIAITERGYEVGGYMIEAEAALAERDKRIEELEALVERMKCCQNCNHWKGWCAIFRKDVCKKPFYARWEAGR